MISTTATATSPQIRVGRVEIRSDGLVNLHLPDGEVICGLPKNKVEQALDWLDQQQKDRELIRRFEVVKSN